MTFHLSRPVYVSLPLVAPQGSNPVYLTETFGARRSPSTVSVAQGPSRTLGERLWGWLPQAVTEPSRGSGPGLTFGTDDDYNTPPVQLRADVMSWNPVAPDPSAFAVPTYCWC